MTAAVLFDFYGTLARAVTWGPKVGELLSDHGLLLDPDAHARWQAEAADGVEHAQASTSRDRYVAWERERLCRLVAGCGARGSTVGEVAGIIYTAMKTYTLEAYPEVPGVLAALRSQGLILAVCSNWDWDLDEALARAGLDQLVDVLVTSARAGARKPHPRIYRHTLERCGVAPGQALFVGDSWGPDVEGPLAVGLRPVHVWREGEPHTVGSVPPPLEGPVRRVADLRGVLDLVPASSGRGLRPG
jgi:putative hydrolase of the HAD superfamily